jgi:anti-anti-sigma factor
VVLDLGAVEFIDSAGIGVLIGLRRRCLEADGECVLAEMTTRVEQLLGSAEVDHLFMISPTVEDAKSLIAQGPWAP